MALDTSTDPQVGYRPPGTLDLASALAPYDGRFGVRHAAHLARRAGFGATPSELDRAVASGMTGAVDALLHPADVEVAFPSYPDPVALFDPKKRTYAAQMWWLDRMLRTNRPLVEKMTLFWHGHFATSVSKVEARFMCEQIDLFRSQALGNFRNLLLSVAQNPAMLIWLDNRSNVAAHPNENFAREVMELFALGLGNYTEDDVKSAARAFTGWGLDKGYRFAVRPAQHDASPKTLLGRTGDLDGTDAIDLIVAQPAHPRFLARKLLEFFVYSDPEPGLVDAVADVYARSGTGIAKTVGAILRSNVFYSPRAYRALPKSPIEFAVGLLRYMDVERVPGDTPSWLARMGQIPLQPPSVKGWDGGPTWINTATLLSRFNLVTKVVRSSPPSATVAPAPAPAPAVSPPPLGSFPAYTPDAIVEAAGGLDAARVLDTILRGAVQDDVTSDVRATLAAYLQSANATLPVPFGPENYEDKIRGVLALVLNLPSNQLN